MECQSHPIVHTYQEIEPLARIVLIAMLQAPLSYRYAHLRPIDCPPASILQRISLRSSSSTVIRSIPSATHGFDWRLLLDRQRTDLLAECIKLGSLRQCQDTCLYRRNRRWQREHCALFIILTNGKVLLEQRIQDTTDSKRGFNDRWNDSLTCLGGRDTLELDRRRWQAHSAAIAQLQ